MFTRLLNSLRMNIALFNTAFIAFTGAAIIGFATVDAESSTPAVWLAAMWVMLAVGLILVLAAIVDAVSTALGKG